MQERESIAPVDQELAGGGLRPHWQYEPEATLRHYLPLVRRVARRLLKRVVAPADLDDLVSWGTLGLIDALAKYERGREALFSTYARFRIRGAILDHLREVDWVPRCVREKTAAVERAARALEIVLGRPAREDELASELNLSLAAYRSLLTQIAPVTMVSLDDLGFGSGELDLGPDHAFADPLRSLLYQERLHLVAEAIRQLPEREQFLLSLYYREELTMREIGTVLGLTESRVSQLHTQALLRVRSSLGAQASSANTHSSLPDGLPMVPTRVHGPDPWARTASAGWVSPRPDPGTKLRRRPRGDGARAPRGACGA
jgi:RNA polymerase sigma factor for flagellar operon FliA